MRIERRVGASVALLGSLLLAVSGAVPALAPQRSCRWACPGHRG